VTIEALEPGVFKRGRGGRPTRGEAERRHRHLLATATRLFLEKGLEGTSMDEISRYPDKAALFVGVVERFRENLLGEMQSLGPLPEAVDEGLVAFGGRLLDLALRPQALAMHRMFIAATIRFPGLVQLFSERARQQGVADIVRVLSAYAERGALQLAEPELMAELFFILTVGMPQRLGLLGIREPPPDEERRLRAAVGLFLDGCRARPPARRRRGD